MLEHQPSQQIKRPYKQHIVNWIEEANSKLNSNICIVKKAFQVTVVTKAFQVTGLSNGLGGHVDAFSVKYLRKAIWDISQKKMLMVTFF